MYAIRSYYDTGIVVLGSGCLGGIATVTKLFPYLKSLVSKEEPKDNQGNNNP